MLYNFVVWFNKNVTNICLVFVILLSLHPFITNNHGHNYYIFMGIFFTFIDSIFVRWHIKDGIKESKFYYILSIIIMVLGITSLFFISGKKEASEYSDWDLFMTTYFGALLGLLGGTFVNDLLNSEKKERELKKQMLNKINDSRVKLNWIDVTKEMPKDEIEVLCRGENGGYFVGIITKKDYGKGHGKYVYEANSGDEAMNHVVCWIYLDEIEKTVYEQLKQKQ